MNFRYLLLILVFFSTSTVFSQESTSLSFQSLENVESAREAALGGFARAVNDGDINIALTNPSLLNDEHLETVALSYAPYFDGISTGYAAYVFKVKDFILLPSIRFFNYGEFEGRDELGNAQGTFSARDLAIAVGSNYRFNDKFSVGANLNLYSAKYESISSSALALNLQGSYINDSIGVVVTAGVDRLGFVMKRFNENEQKLGANFYVSASKKLMKAPFRFFLAFDNLETWDLIPNNLEDPEVNFFDNTVEEVEYGFGDKLLFHTKIGTELVLGKNLAFRVGYNYRRRAELRLPEAPGTAGISWGVEFKVSHFKLAYARTKYHRSFAANNFTISTNLSKF